jgi:hypothetical protein
LHNEHFDGGEKYGWHAPPQQAVEGTYRRIAQQLERLVRPPATLLGLRLQNLLICTPRCFDILKHALPTYQEDHHAYPG